MSLKFLQQSEFDDSKYTVPSGPFTVSMDLSYDGPFYWKLVDGHSVSLECNSPRQDKGCSEIDESQPFEACSQ